MINPITIEQPIFVIKSHSERRKVEEVAKSNKDRKNLKNPNSRYEWIA